jgi:alpha-tubulin suppressor-like RCC1 family protein
MAALNTNRFVFLQKIESLSGKTIRKALAGSNFSLFLTVRGSVLACGQEQWTALTESASKFYRPQQVTGKPAELTCFLNVFFL